MYQQLSPRREADSLEQLEVFSKVSQEEKVRPKVRKISSRKYQKDQIRLHNYLSLDKRINGNERALADAANPIREGVQGKCPATNPLDQAHNHQIRMLREEIERLREVATVNYNNFQNELSFYLLEQYRFLLTLKSLVKTKQYQRIQLQLKNQIDFFQKHHTKRLSSFDYYPEVEVTTSETTSSIVQEDPSFKQLVSNLSENIKDTGITKIEVIPQIKRLSLENQLSVKKLSWYLSQIPFEIESKNNCTFLAKQFMSDERLNSGARIVSFLEQFIQRLSPTYRKAELSTELKVKSQISQLIANHRNDSH